MLSNDDTFALIKKAQSGDMEAKEKLVAENSPLIKSIIKRYRNKGIEYEDLYQLGSMGFIKAINNFSDEYNVKFSTYAVPMIAGEIKRFLRDDGSIKISRSIKHNAILIRRYIENKVAEKGKEPTIEMICKEFNMENADVILCLEANINPLSIDDKIDDELSVGEKIVSDFTCEKLIDKIVLRSMVKDLKAREKQIIILRYYFDKTQTEIAKMMGISQVQISRIENKVLGQFKNEINIK